jgi:hypothetical protein
VKYLMFVCHDTDRTEADRELAATAAPDDESWFDYVRAKGAYVTAIRLHEADTATTVRMRGGELLVTDGPFTEAKEWIGGAALLECADLDEAIDIAARNPMAWHGRLELRPVHSMDEALVRFAEAMAVPTRS